MFGFGLGPQLGSVVTMDSMAARSGAAHSSTISSAFSNVHLMRSLFTISSCAALYRHPAISDQHASSTSQGNKQTTRAAIEFYGPDRAKWLGPLSEGATPDYLTGEFPGEHPYMPKSMISCPSFRRPCLTAIMQYLEGFVASGRQVVLIL